MSDLSYRDSQRRQRAAVTIFSGVVLLWLSFLPGQTRGAAEPKNRAASANLPAAGQTLSPISVDYPADGSIFPPGITPPTFLWRDAAATSWKIDIAFADASPQIHFFSKGERLHIGAIDQECVTSNNQLPQLTPQQAASWAWTPEPAMWSAMQSHSTGQPATMTITGFRNRTNPSSQARFKFTTSPDPVGAPIFYRDVPLMPTEGANGTVQPLAPSAIHLIHWRLRDIRQSESRTVLRDMPTCANCHSFSADGKTMGIDIDGPANDKGLYALAPVQRHMSIQNKDMVQWNTDGQVGQTRVGFMSQVSPDGQYVVSTFAGPSLDIPASYYITNFKDYRFLQVFYPTRGILQWYSRATGRRQPLPGADDPQYVQTDGVWSPDGKYIVFARAVARDPIASGQKPALRANDPSETPIQYDLYRIPFNGGRGGTPELIPGASQNGMSNNFPKVSPDGRWIVFVQCHNGQLMRPDSQLYIVPFGGGIARRMRANTSLMNSWHSFSPNGRWLVFSSKARSPYTQMYLTHIDPDGNDSPAILIDNATAANRAVNIPEFVNIAGDGILDIQVPAVDFYKLIEQAMHLQEQGQNNQALEVWKKALALEPNDARVHNGLAISLYIRGDVQEAFDHLRQAIRINPSFVESHYNLGKFLSQQGRRSESLPELQKAVALKPKFAAAEEALANTYDALGDSSEALTHWRRVLAIEPKRINALTGTAWLLATAPAPALRDGSEAVALAESAYRLAGENPNVLDTLAAAYAENGQFQESLKYANRALNLAVAQKNSSLAIAVGRRVVLYSENKPFRDNEAANVVRRIGENDK
jgi:tetratricopeptide (TPR) repeat protein